MHKGFKPCAPSKNCSRQRARSAVHRAEATALDAAVLMNEHKIGSLLVMDADAVTGIITERDLLQRVIAVRRDP